MTAALNQGVAAIRSRSSCTFNNTASILRRWADEILALSPTALRFIKQSFNLETEHLAASGQLAFTGLDLFVETAEAHEGVTAFAEKREADYGPTAAAKVFAARH